MQVVSSDQARDLIGQQPIYAVWDAAPTLAQELGPIEDLTAHVLSPDWIALYGGDAQSPVTAVSPGLDSDYVEITQSLAPGVVLDGYATRLAPSGAPVTDMQAPAYDVTLRWQLDQQGWPGDLAISVRPTLDGQFIPDPANPAAVLLTDHTGPAQLLFYDRSASSTGTFADPYRLHFPQVAAKRIPASPSYYTAALMAASRMSHAWTSRWRPSKGALNRLRALANRPPDPMWLPTKPR